MVYDIILGAEAPLELAKLVTVTVKKVSKLLTLTRTGRGGVNLTHTFFQRLSRPNG